MTRDELHKRLTRAFSVVSKEPIDRPEIADVIQAATEAVDAHVAAERERLAGEVERDGFDPGKYTLTHPFSNCLRVMQLVRDDCAPIVRGES